MSENESLTLAPPGAGLPWLEAKLVRYLIFPISVRRLSWDKASKRFAEERDVILKLIEGIDAEQLFRPVLIKRIRGIEDSSRNWSIAMTLDHLNIVNGHFGAIVRELSNQRQVKGKASTAAVKPPTVTDPEIVSKFRERCAAYLSIIENETLKDSHSEQYVHPWFGPLTAYKWHCLSAIHQGIHRRQIERILEKL